MGRAVREIATRLNNGYSDDLARLLIDVMPISSASLLILIGKMQPVRIMDLATVWGKSDRQTSVVVGRLVDLGLVEKSREGVAVFCCIKSEDLAKILFAPPC